MLFANLPAELIEKICGYLKTNDLNSLPLTCHTLLQKSQGAYSDYHYRTIWMIITSESLFRLQQIARHDYFRTKVQKLIILPVLFEDHWRMTRESFPSSSFGRGALSSHDLDKDQEDQIPIRYAAYEAIVADHQEALGSLLNFLETCLHLFVNLSIFKLQSEPTQNLASGKIPFSSTCLGFGGIRTQIACRPQVGSAGNLAENWGASSVTARAMSLLFKAIINTNRSVKGLFTCGYDHQRCKGTLANIELSSAEWKALIPLMKKARCLHICSHLKQSAASSCEGLINLVLACAPDLNILGLKDTDEMTDPALQYFPRLSQNITFTKLQELHLSCIGTYLNEFKSLLQTPLPTLKSLTLRYVDLSDEGLPGPTTEEKITETERVWRNALTFLRDECSLQLFYLLGLASRDVEIRVIDRLERVSGRSNAGRSEPRAKAYVQKAAQVYFGEWIDSLKIRPFRRTGTESGASLIHGCPRPPRNSLGPGLGNSPIPRRRQNEDRNRT